jgi:hypothetical protein
MHGYSHGRRADGGPAGAFEHLSHHRPGAGETARRPTRRRQRTATVSARENRSRSGKTQATVAGEIRDFVLQSLKEMLGRWVDIYTGQ